MLSIENALGDKQTFSYNVSGKLYRLTKEVISCNESSLVNEYVYDKVSNRTKKTTTIVGNIEDVAKIKTDNTNNINSVAITGDDYYADIIEGETIYAYNNVYQLITETNNYGTISYVYDRNGNLLRQTDLKNVEYDYDSSNNLISVNKIENSESTEESYEYDYSGNRISKTTNGEKVLYLTDSSSGLSEVIAKFTQDEDSEENNLEALYTLNGSQRLSVTEFTTAEAVSHVYITDSHGDVRALCNENGVTTDAYSYDAYGNILKASGATKNDFLYTSEQYSELSNLYYLRARYMNPSTGSFIGMDSYQGNIYDPISLHKYLYANANPITYADPTGYSSVNELMTASTIDAILCTAGCYCCYAAIKLLAKAKVLTTMYTAAQVAYDAIASIVFDEICMVYDVVCYVKAKIMENLLPNILYITVTTEMLAVQEYVKSIDIPVKDCHGYSVYLLREHEGKKGKVMYVGITSQDPPTKREKQHHNDNLAINKKHPKYNELSNGDKEHWPMQIVATGLTKAEAKIWEQSLICIFTIDALANARYEIAVDNIPKYNAEISRAASLLKVDEEGLRNLINRKEWNG